MTLFPIDSDMEWSKKAGFLSGSCSPPVRLIPFFSKPGIKVKGASLRTNPYELSLS